MMAMNKNDTFTFRMGDSTGSALDAMTQNQCISKGEAVRTAIESVAEMLDGSERPVGQIKLASFIGELKAAGIGIRGESQVYAKVPVAGYAQEILNLAAGGLSIGVSFFKSSPSTFFEHSVSAVLKKFGFSDEDRKIFLANVDQRLSTSKA